jgi:hypothetical protein
MSPTRSTVGFQRSTLDLHLSRRLHLDLESQSCIQIFNEVQGTERMAGVVIYNTVLVHHYRAIERGVSSLRAVALNLYYIAASVIENTGDIDASN